MDQNWGFIGGPIKDPINDPYLSKKGQFLSKIIDFWGFLGGTLGFSSGGPIPRAAPPKKGVPGGGGLGGVPPQKSPAPHDFPLNAIFENCKKKPIFGV